MAQGRKTHSKGVLMHEKGDASAPKQQRYPLDGRYPPSRFNPGAGLSYVSPKRPFLGHSPENPCAATLVSNPEHFYNTPQPYCLLPRPTPATSPCALTAMLHFIPHNVMVVPAPRPLSPSGIPMHRILHWTTLPGHDA
ncbi:unnamed protein product [Penicillium roqueforti FM164]|uniref:Genomic scaffold, ProqFM164S02 n=1 Tax=Penicillium roqueforti (strain FM164) TaxID=1365484 RepID=W6Q9D0_PENRF|nr:unnamed protein product [Penicillium roqueforti FM164]